ncbi:MAG: cell division protein SepF [Vampirovibrionales bacterium]|nr:cell division protein SepF [Vampirovibrionales bacterium]
MSIGLVHKLKHWVSGDPYEEDLYGAEEDTYSYNNNSHHEETEAMSDYETSERSAEQNRFSARNAAPARGVNSRFGKSNLRVLETPAAIQASQVVVVEPKSFEDTLIMVEHLRCRRTVVLNLHLLDMTQSQRVVDFLSGATHAIDGHQQRVGDGVFVFTPSNIGISTELEKAAAMADPYWNTQGFN